MKKILSLLSMACLCLALTGCMEIKGDLSVSSNGEIVSTSTSYIDKEAYIQEINDYYAESGSTEKVNEADLDASMIENGNTIETIDGKVYYVSKEEKETYSSIADFYDKNPDEDILITESSITMLSIEDDSLEDTSEGMDEDSTSQLYDSCYYTISFTLPRAITQKDDLAVVDEENPCTARWHMTMKEAMSVKSLYAACDSDITVTGVTQGKTYRGNVTLSFTGAKTATLNGKAIKSGTTFTNNGTYNILLTSESGEKRTVFFKIAKTYPTISGVANDTWYNTNKKLSISDADGLQSVTVNGSTKYAKGTGIAKTSYALNMKATGKYTVVAKDIYGNAKTIKFVIDKKAPKIKGAKNKKTYKKAVKLRFKDNYGIKKVTINGKKIKNVNKIKKLKKNGKYTVKIVDKAGNKKKIKFTIKKK